ncbi:MAG: ribokinase [Alphaproteobacteria bacterium]|nr:ribokinase [Alphaproteobacteria bacterium]
MSRVLALGNATLDVIQRVDRLPLPGETRIGAAPLRCAGGKGLNQAVAASRAGAAVTLVAAVGADPEGALVRAALATEALDARWIAAPSPTDHSSIWVAADGENMIVSSDACAEAIDPTMADNAVGSLGPGDWLLLQGNLALRTTRHAARAARERGAFVAFNPAPIKDDLSTVLPATDVVVLNAVEAATLGGVAAVLAGGPRLVLLTRGGAGAVLHARDGAQEIAAPQVTAIDTAGAGDVVAGTLVALLARGVTPARAAALAVRAASLSVTREGTLPSFPTHAEMRELVAGGV